MTLEIVYSYAIILSVIGFFRIAHHPFLSKWHPCASMRGTRMLFFTLAPISERNTPLLQVDRSSLLYPRAPCGAQHDRRRPLRQLYLHPRAIRRAQHQPAQSSLQAIHLHPRTPHESATFSSLAILCFIAFISTRPTRGRNTRSTSTSATYYLYPHALTRAQPDRTYTNSGGTLFISTRPVKDANTNSVTPTRREY